MKKYLPWIVVAIMVAWVLATLRPKSESAFALREFGKLPVLMNGRFQPWDSVARNSLLQIRTKQSVPFEVDGRNHTMSAIEWLAEVLMKPEQADTRKIFRIDNGEVKSLLKLADEEKHFSFEQLREQYNELGRQAERVSQVESAKRTPFETQLMKLYNAVTLYQRLKASLKPPPTDDFAAELNGFAASMKPGMEALRARDAGQDYDKEAFAKLLSYMSGFDALARFALPLTIPPAGEHASHARDEWRNIGASLMESVRAGEINPAARSYAAMVSAYRANQPEDFSTAVAGYRSWLAEHKFDTELKKGREESAFNGLQAFYKATAIYVLAFVFVLVAWSNGAEWPRRSAYFLVVFGLLIHTVGLVFRMYLEARPPVTNLYSSAVFIGWGAAILGLILERIYRDGIGCAVASAVGFTTQIIAHNLAVGADTMEMMRAVLDTNFWLATHVVTITLGYSSMFVAGFLAMLYIVRGLFTKSLPEATAKGLVRMVYGITCFSTLFSFVGTVLGGIWADQSWGRFWGWDPKENGALLIVLWCAVMLHARWGGLVKERGLMNMAIFGNVVTAWSWFGVNMLGVGLHSYGFMDSAFKWLLLFGLSQLALIALGCLPLNLWKSFQTSPAESPAKGGKPSTAAA
jgi:ABC-type transport system involved in cytochrome c biogenesis permease subunit